MEVQWSHENAELNQAYQDASKLADSRLEKLKIIEEENLTLHRRLERLQSIRESVERPNPNPNPNPNPDWRLQSIRESVEQDMTRSDEAYEISAERLTETDLQP